MQLIPKHRLLRTTGNLATVMSRDKSRQIRSGRRASGNSTEHQAAVYVGQSASNFLRRCAVRVRNVSGLINIQEMLPRRFRTFNGFVSEERERFNIHCRNRSRGMNVEVEHEPCALYPDLQARKKNACAPARVRITPDTTTMSADL